MKALRTLNSRLVFSHLVVSIISIILMASFAGQSLISSAVSEAEHNLQSLAFAAGNALELPLQELRLGNIDTEDLNALLHQMFGESLDLAYTLYRTDGTPLLDSSGVLPPQATFRNAPEVILALQNSLGFGADIRPGASGERTIYVASLIQREIEVTGILRLSTPLQPALDSARQALLLLILAAVITTSGVGIFGWVLANNLARPIQMLTQAAGQMERGELSVRVKPAGPEELRRLGEAFNSMASRLQSNVNELRAFVANASHELRTPLTVVKLRAEALREGALEDPVVAERFLGEIESEIDRLVRMVNDLLDLSRMEAGLGASKRSTFELSGLAQEAYETLNIRAAKAGVKLDLDVEVGLPPVNGYEDQIRRVLFNLMDNALKYTPEGGRVEVLLRPGPKENTIRLLVRDTGPGIAPEHLPHVFERFYRADGVPARVGSSRGSGLGLAIAKSIVDNHGGEMGVSSQMGQGTTFWADLPAAA